MSARRSLTARVAVIAAVAIALPVASASTAAKPATPATLGQIPSRVTSAFECPRWYGVRNPVSGCDAYWLIAYGFLTSAYGALGFPSHAPAVP
jgi:hypothetical protein